MNPESGAQKCLVNLCSRIHECQKNKLTIDYIRNNLSRLITLSIYLLVNLALILYVVIYQSTVTKSSALAVIARASGMLMNFNCAFVIVLMLKQSILIIRTVKWLRKWIPVDDHIDFHRFVGRVIAVLALIHTIAHMSNFITMNGKRGR